MKNVTHGFQICDVFFVHPTDLVFYSKGWHCPGRKTPIHLRRLRESPSVAISGELIIATPQVSNSFFFTRLHPDSTH